MIKKAELTDLETVKDIVRSSIKAVYPRYYPAGAVEFFLSWHSDERITRDLSAGRVYIRYESNVPAGTVTVSKNEVDRLFVRPELQHRGIGRELLAFAEAEIKKESPVAILCASLPAKPMYLDHGYGVIRTDTADCANGDVMCYDVMAKSFLKD